MEAILPFKIKNEQKFFDSALKVGYNEMEALKFIYVVQQSDLDIFPIMHDERINVLLYGWELCEDYKQNLNPNEWELPEELETVLKILVPWSMDIWFSKEWDKCKYYLKTGLIHCLNRARDLLMRMPDMMQINWDFLLLYNLKPWNVLYLKNLTVVKDKTLENGAQSIETEELPATDEDIAYVKLEQLPIIVLRLVKFFDQSSIDMVKTLCMRVIAAWNKIYQTELETSGSRRPYIPPEDKRCLLLICHIYLMAVYEADDVKGYVIDNMINNIRFYYQGFQNSTPLHVMDNFEYTPARYIALTNFHLRVQKRDFFDFFIWNKYDTSLVNLFGVVSQAYKSYLLGNLLMELNNMNEDDFAANIPLYKRLMNSYVNEREKSEIFLLSELTKVEHQRYAHNVIQTVRNITDYESKICKGNRMSNIGNYENSDDTVAPLVDAKAKDDNNSELKMETFKEEVIDEDVELEQKRVKESELRLDPVFQNLPNNESMLYYVYDVLAKKDYKGWHFAKVVLLVKIIGHEQNMIETWRYHPGLTTDFMLNLEVNLSHHYVDLAKIFRDHPFLEQEFWLTAFYLDPTPELYEVIKRLGMRNNRKRTDEHTKLVMSIDNIEAKYGLLSSTIDVKELATMSNTDDPTTDYDPLFSALHSLRVPDSLIKDMLTAIFLPRNRSFAWAVDWVVLRNRCKMIMTSSKEKKRFVDLNMAEANERLKYLIIDYDKYKNRPQLDYGTIEQGYESLMTGGDFDKDSSEEEEDDEEEEDFEDDEDVYESKKRGRGRISAAARKKEEQKPEDENSQEDDPFLMGKRRTRARTAATLASFLFQTLPRSSRRRRNQKSEEESKTEDEKISNEHDDRSSDSKSPLTTSPTRSPYTANCNQKENSDANVPTKNLKECLKRRPAFFNTTKGFQNLIDIWNVEKTDLQSIDENCVSLMESSAALQIAVKLKSLNKEINPISCDDKEYIDDREMIIHNAEYGIKMEYDFEESEISEVVASTNNLNKNALTMDINHYEENVESYRNENIDNESGVEALKDSSQLLKVLDDQSIEKVVGEKNEDIPVESSIEKATELPEETTEEKVEGSRNDDIPFETSIEQCTKLPEETTEEKVTVSRNEDTNPGSSIGDSTETNFKLPDEMFAKGENEKSTDLQIESSSDKSMESSFKFPEETIVEKETRQKASDANRCQDLNQVEENSSESLISDLSTAALKDSSEVSEANSKRNSFNIDIEIVEKLIRSDDLSDKTETSSKLEEVIVHELEEFNKELIETKHGDKGTTNVQIEESKTFVMISNEKELNDENETKECNKDQQELYAEVENMEVDTEAHIENRAEEGNKEPAVNVENETGETNNQQEEIKAEEKPGEQIEITAKNKALQENKVESESEMEEGNKVKEAKVDNNKSLEELHNQSDGNANEIAEDDKAKELTTTSENKTERESAIEKENNSATEQKENEISKSEDNEENKAEKESEPEKEHNSSLSKADIETEAEENKTPERKTEKTEELENRHTKLGNESETKTVENNDNSKNTKSSMEEECIIIAELEKSTDEVVKNLLEIDSEDRNNIEILQDINELETENLATSNAELKESLETNKELDGPILSLTKVENISSDNKWLDDKSMHDRETTKDEEANVSIGTFKHLDDVSKEECETPEIELNQNLEINDNASKIEETEKEKTTSAETPEVVSSSKILENYNEPTADLIETNDGIQEQNYFPANEEPEISKSILSDVTNSLDTSENLESNIILHYTSSEERNEENDAIDQIQTEKVADETPEDANIDEEKVCEKPEESSDNQTKCEQIVLPSTKDEDDQIITESVEGEGEKVIPAPSYQTEPETLNSTKTEDAADDRTTSETNENTHINDTLLEVTDPKSIFTILDETSIDSVKSTEYIESTDSETRELKNLCLRKNAKVLLRRLTPSELTILRQPKVIVQRTSYEKYLMEFRPKRRRIEEKVYLEFDESSNSINSYGTSSSEAYRPPRTKRKIPVKRHALRQVHTSDSDNDSKNSEDTNLSAMMAKKRRRHTSPASTSRSSAAKRVSGPKSARRTGPKSKRQTTGPKSSKQNLVVTPRSASGLKLRISNAERNQHATGPASKQPKGIIDGEIIQLSSTSSDECIWSELNTIQEEIIEIEVNPLFEEEIII